MNIVRAVVLTVALVALAMSAYAHDADKTTHRSLYISVEVELLKSCIRLMWGGDASAVPVEAWEPMARLCSQIVRESRDR